MKVAFVTPSYHPAYAYGGPTYSALGLSTALARAGCEVRVLTTDANGRGHTLDVDTRARIPIEPRLSVRYCHRIARDSISPAFVRALPEVLAWSDIVHLTAVYNFTTLPTMVAAKTAGKPLVWTPRGALQRWERSTRRGAKGMWEAACRGLLPARAALHVTSQREADQSGARFPQLPVFVIPNGVDLPPPRSGNRQPPLKLLFVGRLDPIKGLENLLVACGLLAQRGVPDWSLVLAGDGTRGFVEGLRKQADDLGISSRVTFAGHVEGAAKDALLRAADLFVIPSHSENFGNVVTEALAYGVPVIASRGTPWSRLDEEGCGLWVANDPESLAAAIETMRGRSLDAMGAKGRLWMEREFSWPRVAELTVQMYRSL